MRIFISRVSTVVCLDINECVIKKQKKTRNVQDVLWKIIHGAQREGESEASKVPCRQLDPAVPLQIAVFWLRRD